MRKRLASGKEVVAKTESSEEDETLLAYTAASAPKRHLRAPLENVINLVDDEEEEEENESNEPQKRRSGPPKLREIFAESESSQETRALDAQKRLRRGTISKRILAPTPEVQVLSSSSSAAAAVAAAAATAASRPVTRASLRSSTAKQQQQPSNPEVVQRGAAAGITSTMHRPQQTPAAVPSVHRPASAAVQMPASSVPQGVEDIDNRRARDPTYVPTYAAEAYENLRQLQFRYWKPCAAELDPPPVESRPMLVDWMVHVTEEYAMSSDVLFLSVALMDRAFFQADFVENEHFLVACACVMLACKMEDVYTPTVDEFVQFMEDQPYTRKDLLAMERAVLDLLRYRLHTATAKPFVRRFQRAAAVETLEEKMLGNFIVELTLPAANFLVFTPTLVAAGAVYLARYLLRFKVIEPNIPRQHDPFEGLSPQEHVRAIWTPTLQHYTGYSLAEISLVVFELWVLYQKVMTKQYPEFFNLIRKYESNECTVANIKFQRQMVAKHLPPIVRGVAISDGGR